MAAKAYVFARPGGALIFGSPYGHEAFGFQTDENETTLVGGVELGGPSLSHIDDAMRWWTRLTPHPLQFMAAHTPFGRRTRYDMAKVELDPTIGSWFASGTAFDPTSVKV